MKLPGRTDEASGSPLGRRRCSESATSHSHLALVIKVHSHHVGTVRRALCGCTNEGEHQVILACVRRKDPRFEGRVGRRERHILRALGSVPVIDQCLLSDFAVLGSLPILHSFDCAHAGRTPC